MPKISVVMPVFNTKEDYLRKNIESVLNQSFSDFEYLILDDASKPYIEEIIKSYSDNRIKYFKNEHNLGISESRNKLLSLATGEYLAIVDHDDVSLPERFAKQVAVLDANESIGVVSSHFVKINKHGKHSSSWRSFFSKKRNNYNAVSSHNIKLNLFSSCVVAHPAAMIRKKVLQDNNISYEKEFFPAEDYALWCRLIPHTEFYIIPEALLHYRRHSANTFKKNYKLGQSASFKIRSFVSKDNPAIFQEYSIRSYKTYVIKIFGLLPLFKVELRDDFVKIYLFELILLLKLKIKSNLG